MTTLREYIEKVAAFASERHSNSFGVSYLVPLPKEYVHTVTCKLVTLPFSGERAPLCVLWFGPENLPTDVRRAGGFVVTPTCPHCVAALHVYREAFDDCSDVDMVKMALARWPIE